MTDTSQTNLTDGTLAGDAHVTSADGNAAVSPDSLTLTELNQMLGKDFKDKATALKAVSDTFSFVGKRKEDIAKELASLNGEPTPADAAAAATSKDSAEVQTLKRDMFYLANPEYKDFKSLIESLGTDPTEVVGSQVFKDTFEKLKGATSGNIPSVVHSNSRIGSDKSAITEAIAATNAGSKGDAADILAKEINAQMTGK